MFLTADTRSFKDSLSKANLIHTRVIDTAAEGRDKEGGLNEMQATNKNKSYSRNPEGPPEQCFEGVPPTAIQGLCQARKSQAPLVLS